MEKLYNVFINGEENQIMATSAEEAAEIAKSNMEISIEVFDAESGECEYTE